MSFVRMTRKGEKVESLDLLLLLLCVRCWRSTSISVLLLLTAAFFHFDIVSSSSSFGSFALHDDAYRLFCSVTHIIVKYSNISNDFDSEKTHRLAQNHAVWSTTFRAHSTSTLEEKQDILRTIRANITDTEDNQVAVPVTAANQWSSHRALRTIASPIHFSSQFSPIDARTRRRYWWWSQVGIVLALELPFLFIAMIDELFSNNHSSH